MSRRFVYSLVRCVPEPRTGEFVNIGAIAGDPEGGDWAVRQVSSERRAVKLASPSALEAVHGFLARTQEAIELQDGTFDQDGVAPSLTVDWLSALCRDHQNVVQIAAPTPMLADSAEDALDIIFEHMIIDPVSQARGFITKHAVLASLRDSYGSVNLAAGALVPRADIFVGSNLHAGVDFAVLNGAAVQVSQAWSFQRAGVQDVSTQVKAWAYAMSRVQDGEAARVVAGDRVVDLPRDVDVQVVVAGPRTMEQEKAFDEATQVFSDLGVEVSSFDQAEGVGVRAAELLAKR